MKRILLLIFLFPFILFAQDYDYLIIAPDVFMDNQTWYDDIVTLQISRGFQPIVELVSTKTTADEIKCLIQDYYNNYDLKFVLLMGSAKNLTIPDEPDTTYPYQYRPHGVISDIVDPVNGCFIPFHSVLSENQWSPSGYIEVASDDPYINELLEHGEVFIGRIPVESVDEANKYVTKLVQFYDNQPNNYSDVYDKEILLNLDVNYSNGCSGELVTFLINDLINEHLPNPESAINLKVSEHPCGDPFAPCSDREELFENYLNEGAALMTLLSTMGGPVSLGSWYRNDIPFNLSNINTALPFLIATNCHQGEVNNPDYESTMRKLMIHPNGGIIGALAPTEGSEQYTNGYILNRFHDLINQDESLTLGEIFRIIKNDLITNDISLIEYFTNSLTFFGDPSMYPSIYKHKSSNITASTTWSGNIVVDNSISVAQGATLTISPGTKIFFNSGTSLIVSGSLSANNVLFSAKENYWLGIYFGTGSSGVIDGCTIEKVYYESGGAAVTINGANPEIKNSHIINNILGTNGISILNTTNPWIHHNWINNNGESGIYLNNASAYIHNNQISGHSNNAAISVINGSEVTFSNPLTQTHGYNDLIQNKWGLYAYHNCVLNAGFQVWTGYNRIFNNTEKNASAGFHSTIYAMSNWWGQNPPDLTKFYVSGSSLLYNPYLTSDPLGDNPNISVNNNGTQNDNPNNPFLEAKELRRLKNYPDAFNVYKQIIRKNLQSDEACLSAIEISNLFKEYKNNQLFQFIDSLNIHLPAGNLKAEVLVALSKLNAIDSNFTGAININNIIMQNYPGTDFEKNARVSNILYYLYLNQTQPALYEFDSLTSHFPESEEIAIIENVFHFEGIGTQNKFKKSVEQGTLEITEYNLEYNYPNPFNPSTMIQYQIPVNGFVTLKVYDILGREVRTLVNKDQNIGRYEVEFDASELASGIYIYQIKSGEYLGSKKMILIK